MKKHLLVLAAVIMVSALILGGCSSSPATTTAAPAPTTTAPEPVTSTQATTPISSTGKAITIRLAPTTTGPPPGLGITLIATEMAKILEERTQGQVKFEIYWSETLAKGTELVNAVQTNIANMAYLRTFAEPGKLPLATVGELPGVGSDTWALNRAYADLIVQDPIKSEFAKYNIKGFSSFTILEQQIIANMPIRSLAELKGKKIAASGVAATIYQRLEAVPVAMSPTEQYEGLSRGTIDAISVPLDAIQNFKFYEAGKYFINIKTVPRVHPIVFNQNFWDSLPQDVQQSMTDAVPDLITSAEESNATTAGVAWEEMKDAGVEVIEWSAEDVAQVNKVLNEFADSWASDTDAKGLPGSKVLADYRVLYEKYAPLSPYKK